MFKVMIGQKMKILGSFKQKYIKIDHIMSSDLSKNKSSYQKD
jgi:hypothetical protein